MDRRPEHPDDMQADAEPVSQDQPLPDTLHHSEDTPPPARYARHLTEDCQRVLQRLTRDGSLDDIRKRLAEHLRNHEELNRTLRAAVAASPCIGALDLTSRQGKKTAVHELKRELNADLMSCVSEIVWTAMTDPASPIAQDIAARAHEAFCTLLVDEAQMRHLRLQQQQQQQQQHQHQQLQQQQRRQ